ncbi:MAG: hypothetical protein ACOC1O_02825, partial [bacterium]
WLLDVKYYDYAKVKGNKEQLNDYERYYISTLEPKGNYKLLDCDLSKLDIKKELDFSDLIDISKKVNCFKDIFLHYKELAKRKSIRIEKELMEDMKNFRS